MERRERQRLDEAHRRLEVLLRLARVPDDDVGAEAQAGNRRGEPLHEGPVHGGVVGPAHQAQHAVAPALERQVQMRRHHRQRRHRVEQLGREVGRQHRGEAQPAEPLHLRELPEQGGQRGARVEIPAVVADVHPGERDVEIAGGHEGPHLVEHDLGLLAPAPPARGRHDAEGAAVLAAVLDLHEGARAARHPREGRDRDSRASPMSATATSGRARLVSEPSSSGRRYFSWLPTTRSTPAIAAAAVRVGLGVAAGHDQVGFRVLAGDAADELAIGEVRAAGHRAGVDHVHLRARLRAPPPGSRALPAARRSPGTRPG